MKKLFLTFITASVFFVGCKDNSNKEAQATDNPDVETQVTADPDQMRYADASLTATYAVDTEGMDIDDQTRDEVQSWDELNTFDATLLELEENPEADIPTYSTNLRTQLESLEASIPESMKTEEIQEDIKDINEEIADLELILEEPEVNENKISRQVEELVEAYDDLNEEIKETMMQNSKKRKAMMKEDNTSNKKQ